MSTTAPTGVDLAGAREHFLSLIDSVRPDLHRYVSRLVGSAIDGEDIVQDTLAKACYALSLTPEQPHLRPWLFRIGKNTAIDFLRRYERRHVDGALEVDTMANADERDPEVIRAAVHTFMTLPISQRTAVIMKDVLDESLEDIADHLGTTVGAVKSLLVRGRQALKQHAAQDATAVSAPVATQPAEHRALVRRYIALFNQKDWVGVLCLAGAVFRSAALATRHSNGSSPQSLRVTAGASSRTGAAARRGQTRSRSPNGRARPSASTSVATPKTPTFRCVRARARAGPASACSAARRRRRSR